MGQQTTRNASLGGAVAAAIAASACCVGPLIFALLGIGGAGALVALEHYRPLFSVLTVGLLGVGWYLSYRQPAPVGDDCGCELPKTNKAGKTTLWIATLLACLSLVFPYLTPYIF